MIACKKFNKSVFLFMKYRVARNGSELGEFSEDEIKSGLSSGNFLPGDLGWREGMQEWKGLGLLFPAEGDASSFTGSSTGIPAPAVPPPVFSTGQSIISDSYASQPATNAGLAIAALVIGIASLVTCGMLGVGALAAIICGHIALSKITKSQGALKGRGMAMAGLMMGYVSIVLLVILIIVSISIPAATKVLERAEMTLSFSEGQQLITACKLYAADNNGKMPDNLEQLVTEGILESEQLQDFLTDNKGQTSFEYVGAGKTDADAGDTIVLEGLIQYSGNKRIVGYLDSSVQVITDAP